MRLIGFGMILALAACDMGHLGNPVMWPGMAVGSGLENASYNARRRQVQDHLAQNYVAVLTDIRSGGGPALTLGADLARVPPGTRPELIRSLKRDIAKFTPDTPAARERLLVWFMVHGS